MVMAPSIKRLANFTLSNQGRHANAPPPGCSSALPLVSSLGAGRSGQPLISADEDPDPAIWVPAFSRLLPPVRIPLLGPDFRHYPLPVVSRP